eukprot:351440-Chlamydomonas_euryale.AAC.4
MQVDIVYNTFATWTEEFGVWEHIEDPDTMLVPPGPENAKATAKARVFAEYEAAHLELARQQAVLLVKVRSALKAPYDLFMGHEHCATAFEILERVRNVFKTHRGHLQTEEAMKFAKQVRRLLTFSALR